MGFGLYFFRAPEQIAPPAANPAAAVAEPQTDPGIARNVGVPTITSVEPMVSAPARPNLMTMKLDPPMAIMTTEGGLTGRNAPAPTQIPAGGAGPAASARRPIMTSPPPLPDLMP